MQRRLFSLVFVLSSAGAFSAWAQVQQPTATMQPRVASKKLPFYSTEILGAKYHSNHIKLEHPSNPATMQRTRKISPFVRVAGADDDIPTQHLFDDSANGTNLNSDGSVPPPPGTQEDSITPITREEAESSQNPLPEPAPVTASSVSQAAESVVITEPVVVTNVGSSLAVSSDPVFQAGPNDSYVDVSIGSSASNVVPAMGSGCSN